MVRLKEILNKLKGKDYLLFADYPQPLSIAQISALLDCSYGGANQKVMTWYARGWLRKINVGKGKILYAPNVDKEEAETVENI